MNAEAYSSYPPQALDSTSLLTVAYTPSDPGPNSERVI